MVKNPKREQIGFGNITLRHDSIGKLPSCATEEQLVITGALYVIHHGFSAREKAFTYFDTIPLFSRGGKNENHRLTN